MEQFEYWLLDTHWFITAFGIGTLLLFGWLAGASQNLRRSRAFLVSFNDSTRGVVSLHWGPNFRGFFAKIQPAPEPFSQFIITYHAVSNLNVLGLLFRPLTRQMDRMIIHGKLTGYPSAELIWVRGQVPSHALGHGRGATLWVQHHLDFMNCEYATRGINPSGLVHVFADLQARFGPWLRKVSIQGDDTPEMEIVINTARLNAEEMSALVTTLRAAGRAALLR